MKLTRRNTIIGLAALAGGAGAINATGAFDAVEANRDFNVEVSGDAGALLGLEVTNQAVAGTDDGGAGDNDVIFFQLDDEENEETALNEAAETTFYSVFVIANNGSQDEVDVSIDTGDADGVYFDVPETPNRTPEDTDNNEMNNENVGPADLEADGVVLNAGQAVVIDLTINTRDTNEDDDGGYVAPDGDPYEMTITAESPDAQ